MAAADINSRVRGTPLEVAGHPARLILVLLILFFSFPAILYKPLTQLDALSSLPEWLVCFCLLGGATSWAWASFMASSAWLSFGLAAFIGTGLHLASTQAAGLIPPGLVSSVVLALVVAGLLSTASLRAADAVVIVGLVAAASTRLAYLDLSPEEQVLLTVLVVTLLTAPGIIGHHASRVSAMALMVSCFAAGTLATLMNRTAPTLVLGLLVSLLAFVRLIGLPPEPTPATKQTARASRYLLAGLVWALAAMTTTPATKAAVEASAAASSCKTGLAITTLALAGASCALIVTSLLARTAHTWGPVRSGEYQMVTLDFLALLLYFVLPLAVLLYLTWLQLPSLPAGLTGAIDVPQLHFLRPGTLPLALSLAVLLVFTQESFEESSILWAHWLISTFTFGALDSKNVALAVRLDPLLKHAVPKDLPGVLKASGLSPLNIFVSKEVVSSYPDLVKALADDGHTLGTETAAGPFTPFTTAFNEVQSTFDQVKACIGGVAPPWYLGTGGHRNPWALLRAAALHQSLIAPVLVVRLGATAGADLRQKIDGWYKGGLVFLDADVDGEVDLKQVLGGIKAKMQEGGYKATPLSTVCQKVQKMML